MKKIILITMLISAVFAQSDCNENNWQDYYNSDGKDMSDCDLRGAHLSGRTFEGANLAGAILEGVQSDNIRGLPISLPDGWSLVDGTLENRELSDEIFRQINEGKAIKKSKWRAWKNENDPQVSKGKTTFKNLDKNNNGKISSGEFFKFHKRWIQN